MEKGKRWSKPTKKWLTAAVFLILTLFTVGTLSRFTELLETLELKTLDFLMAVVRGPLPAPEDIVIVAVDNASVVEFQESLNVSLPWPRSLHAELINALNQAQAKVIVFDVVFEEASDPEEDTALADAIFDSQAPVVLAAAIDIVEDPRFSMIRELRPLSDFTDAGGKTGFATLNLDRDGIIRQGRLLVGGEPSLSVQAYLETAGALDWDQIPIHDYEGEDPQILLNYVGGPRSIPTVSYYQALDFENALPEGIFRDKIVFVGYSLAVADLSHGPAQDHYSTPFDKLGGGTTMAGVEIQATILNTLLTRNFLRRADPLQVWVILAVLGGMVTFIVASVDSFPWKIILSVGLILGSVSLSAASFVYANFWLYSVQGVAIMLTVFLLNILYQYRASEQARAQIRSALSGYVSSQVMQEVLKDPERLRLGGTQLEATVLFTDIAGFSKISESLSPQELATLLNDYFTRMGDAIMAHDGMINKYIGDAIMAIWNAPLPNPRHALLACQAALEMQRIVEGMELWEMRIGINTGQMVAGNLGHQERMEYTVIGDTVNLASRLEGANKAYGTTILISETTEAQVRNDLLLRPVDRIRVVGKERPVRVYEVVGPPDQIEDSRVASKLNSFKSILECYESRDWERGDGFTREHLARFPDDSVAQTYLVRFQRFQEDPPPEDWDGTYSLQSK